MTLGKFAPFHKGHQLLIERALAETDHVIVIIYNASETTTVPLPVRAEWIRRLYPAVEVLEAWDGPTIVGDTPEIRELHESFLHRFLGPRKVTHFYCSEFYGAHVSRALGAVDCRIDSNRTEVPISATAIRQNPYQYRHFLPPLVYRDLITRVVLLGAPSTGKSTLAEALARRYQTTWMPEFGRAYWEENQHDRRLTLEQLVEIAEGHIQREENLLLEANKLLFVDTDASTTFMFSLYYHGESHPRLKQMAADTINRYDLFFLCENDIPYEDTWDRSGEVNRSVFQEQIRADLLRRNIPFVSLRGSLDSRIATVEKILQDFDRFSSIGDQLLGLSK